MSKSWWLSKTLWVNFIAAVAFFLQQQYGWVVPVELQSQILVVVNILLRLITKSELK